jgi:hypothetical protein
MDALTRIAMIEPGASAWPNLPTEPAGKQIGASA